MKKINPELSQKFLKEIKNQKSEIVDIDGVKIKTCKNVFPPRSNFSRTSEKLHIIFGDLKGLAVLDVGTGTGVQTIQAVIRGARKAVGLDINPEAVSCAKENIELNCVKSEATILQSDLFSALKLDEKFDIVIANLPITDYPIEGIVESSLYDPEYRLHRRFFAEVGKHLTSTGIIIMTHINFKGTSDFEKFEKMVSKYGYKIERFIEIEDIGHLWRMYRIKPNTV
ncbi:MAG: class I SAM-dependent methyltransferase [Candidatus Paceibacterota bacterium]|jgi:methylase of polypeptide subunit release factors